MKIWEAFAHEPGEDAGTRVVKTCVFIVAGSCCMAGVVWALVYAIAFGWGVVAALPLCFVAIVGSALVISHLRRDPMPAIYAQIVCIIAIPTLLDWTIGGIFKSGVVIVWALLGPMAALMFLSRRESALWFGAFVVALAISLAFNPTFASHGEDVDTSTRLLFTAMNLGVASTVLFGFAGYFVSQAIAERRRADRLLLNVLPAPIALALKENDATIAEHFESASVLFADIVGSTPLFSELHPTEAVDWLNEVFSTFDALTERCGLEKIKTIGDNYMVASGVPLPRDDHAAAITRLGLDMIDALEQIPARHGRRLEFRVGISSGPLVAGVIGTHKFQYDVWGDTVNTASRMESHGEVRRVHITDDTRRLLGPGFACEERGTIDIKGKGQMRTWFVARTTSSDVLGARPSDGDGRQP